MKSSFWTNLATVIGFFVLIGLLITMLGGLLGFTLHVLLPIALVILVVQRLTQHRRHQAHYNETGAP